MRIAVAATPEVALPTLEKLLMSSHELVCVITTPDKPSGRGQKLHQSPVALWASEKEVLTHKPEKGVDLSPYISEADLLITIGYGVILPKSTIDAPRFGSLNLHFSLLPRWRGAAPVQRCIEAGDAVSGVTVFALDEGMDTGPIYTQMRFALDSDITSDELFIELSELGALAIFETLDLVESHRKPTPQNDQEATRAFKLSKEEGCIDWSQSADVIAWKIRAFTSQPGAWTTFRGSVLKVQTPVMTWEKLEPGVIKYIEKRLLVGTGSTALEIGVVIPEGKSKMMASQWANGARLSEGEFFG